MAGRATGPNWPRRCSIRRRTTAPETEGADRHQDRGPTPRCRCRRRGVVDRAGPCTSSALRPTPGSHGSREPLDLVRRRPLPGMESARQHTSGDPTPSLRSPTFGSSDVYNFRRPMPLFPGFLHMVLAAWHMDDVDHASGTCPCVALSSRRSVAVHDFPSCRVPDLPLRRIQTVFHFLMFSPPIIAGTGRFRGSPHAHIPQALACQLHITKTNSIVWHQQHLSNFSPARAAPNVRAVRARSIGNVDLPVFLADHLGMPS